MLMTMLRTLCANESEKTWRKRFVLAEIQKLAEIIPLCPKLVISTKRKMNWFNNQVKACKDCGLYMVTYAECLSYGKRVPLIEFNPNTLRTFYAAQLWDYIWHEKTRSKCS
ncbi:hypothetical protein P3L10_005911 [Capsicum annuum]